MRRPQRGILGHHFDGDFCCLVSSRRRAEMNLRGFIIPPPNETSLHNCVRAATKCQLRLCYHFLMEKADGHCFLFPASSTSDRIASHSF